MRLLKFVTLFAVGGTERQFVNLAVSLDRSKVDVRFGCLRKWGQLVETVEDQGIAIDDYGVTSFRSPRAVRAQLRLARDIRRNRIDVVHSYNFYANVFAIPAAKLAGARVVASIRDMGAYLSPMQKRMQRFACRFADHILVNAEAIREWLVSDGYDAERITVIPNGIDMTRFRSREEWTSIREELGVAEDTPLAGYVGRIERRKGLEDLLAAAAIIVRDNAAVRFVIAGVQQAGLSAVSLQFTFRLLHVVPQQFDLFGEPSADALVQIAALIDVHLNGLLRERIDKFGRPLGIRVVVSEPQHVRVADLFDSEIR